MSKQVSQLTETRCAALRSVYDELSRAHDSVAAFRAKLLALLPIASGTGLFAVLSIGETKNSQHLLAIGIFGALVTLALYMYEMRGIQRCGTLRARALKLEEALVGKEVEGAFAEEPQPRFFLATNTWAARIVYPATISVWAYVAFCGLNPKWEPGRVPLSLGIFLLLLAGGHLMAQSKAEVKPSNQSPADGRVSRAAEAN